MGSGTYNGHRVDGKESPTYGSWRDMKRRCRNPGRPDFKYYGARGVQVCPRWLGRDGFRHFLEDMGERPEGTSLDRIDVMGHYEPSNCRWSTPLIQTQNRRPPWDEELYGPVPEEYWRVEPKWPELVVEVAPTCSDPDYEWPF